MALEKALQAAQQGNFSFVQSMPQAELHQLLSKADEDGRTLLHAAAARWVPTVLMRAYMSELTGFVCSGHSNLVSYLLSNGGQHCVTKSDDEVLARSQLRLHALAGTHSRT